jgi:uncharacterized protein (DUF952 family)
MNTPSMPTTIYKICASAHWQAAQHDGMLRGTADDLRDGFIHFSTAEQVAETLARHFAGQGDLVLIGADAEELGPALKWEPSRGGALFPHLYGELPLNTVTSVQPLPLAADGRHLMPKL